MKTNTIKFLLFLLPLGLFFLYRRFGRNTEKYHKL